MSVFTEQDVGCQNFSDNAQGPMTRTDLTQCQVCVDELTYERD